MTETAEIALVVGRIEGKVDLILAHQGRQDAAAGDKERRIRKLELADRRYGTIAGAVAALVATVAELGRALLRPA